MQKLIREGAFKEDWTTGSAGTWAAAGRAAHPHTLAILGEQGIDLSEHRSREVTAEMIAAADLTLTMEAGQAEALRAEFPEAADKVHLLSELGGKQWDLVDPVGGTKEDFRETMDLMEGYLRGREDVLLRLIEEEGKADCETGKR